MLFDHVKLKPAEQISIHTQSSWELSYVIQGRGERRIGDKSMPFKEGDMVLVVPNMPHRWAFQSNGDNEDIENITVLFDDAFITDCFSHIAELESVKNFYLNLQESILIEDDVRDEVACVLFSMKKETEAQKVISLMRILCLISLATKTRSAGRFVHRESRSDKLNRAKIYVRCNYAKPIGIKDLAEHLGMSETGFCNFWKQMTGSRFFEFLIKHRLDVACEILHNPSKSVSDACFESGFNDLAYFSRSFKKRMGISPSQYRGKMNNLQSLQAKNYNGNNSVIDFNLSSDVRLFTAGRGAVLPCDVTVGHQVHGDRVAVVLRLGMTRDELDGYDALVTNLPGCAIGVRTADCIPILLYDPVHKAVAAVHAGWRGTVLRVLSKTVTVLAREYGTDAKDLKALIGPGICRECFQVGEEVVSAFEQAGFSLQEIHSWNGPKVNGDITTGHHINLQAANRSLLLQEGVIESNIQISGICTYENNTLFSARREGAACGRNINAIMIF